jgi:hypothetical protein
MINVAISLTKDEILRGVYPEPSLEILRCAQNDRGKGLRMTDEGLGMTILKTLSIR